jgi:hypothetical protein
VSYCIIGTLFEAVVARVALAETLTDNLDRQGGTDRMSDLGTGYNAVEGCPGSPLSPLLAHLGPKLLG